MSLKCTVTRTSEREVWKRQKTRRKRKGRRPQSKPILEEIPRPLIIFWDVDGGRKREREKD